MLSSHKIRVGVLRGGVSPEYKVSLETGRNVLANLPEEHYTPIDVFISRSGDWHVEGVAREPDAIIKNLDVVFNALHGQYGEDGGVQKLLDGFSIPYTGSGALASSLGMNKIMSKKVYTDSGLKTPFHVSIALQDLHRNLIREVYTRVPLPFVVKPASAGSSIGVRTAYSLSELEEAIVSAFEYSPSVLVEEFIAGREATCGVVEGFRGRGDYTLIPHADKILSVSEKKELEAFALTAHRALGLRHYSSSDFIVSPKRGIFILETDTLPVLHEKSVFPQSLQAVGSNISEFLHHVIGLAQNVPRSR